MMMKEEGQEPKNVGSLWELEKARKWIISHRLQKGMQFWWYDDFSPVNPVSDLELTELCD